MFELVVTRRSFFNDSCCLDAKDAREVDRRVALAGEHLGAAEAERLDTNEYLTFSWISLASFLVTFQFLSVVLALVWGVPQA